MLFGIDVGGTHTDAVLIDKEKGIRAYTKIPTVPDDLLGSIRAAIKEILSREKNINIQRFNLSTTLCTNAIVQDMLAPVGMLVSAGPGIHPENFRIGDFYEIIPGGLDHRGTEISPLDLDYAKKVMDSFLKEGIEVFSVVSKFSPRNPLHEEQLASLIKDKAKFITKGYNLSAQLNFPRRITTAYYNSAVWPIFIKFLDSVEDCLNEFNFSPQINILKADGGTMTIVGARMFPVESIFSGPAASVMGIISLCDIREDAIVMDVGGTTTDIGVFASGVPLIEPENVSLKQRPTLVRAMKVKSIGLGGDSMVCLQDDAINVGPKRVGPCMASGGDIPTFLDALNIISDVCYGDKEASFRGIAQLTNGKSCVPNETATKIVEQGCKILKKEVTEFINEINERPIYTIHELLEFRKIEPKKIYLMGGPAKILAPFVEREFGLPVIVPEYFEVANAIGAALARPTMQAELLADTEKCIMTIPELGITERVSKHYNLKVAREELKAKMEKYINEKLLWDIDLNDIEIIEESSMNMVKDVFTVGKDIRVRCQVRPSISKEFESIVRCICNK